MRAQNEPLFLIVTAIVETAAGICLLFLPAVVFAALLGLADATREAIFVARLTGAALFAIGVASWMARTDTRSPAQLGLLTGIFIYNVAASTLLGLAGALLKMVGVLLWPAVALHAVLAVWCFICLRRASEAGR
jgi:quinol-cytochrome oxidoreductase complex cytochrome b subunit